MGAVVFQDTTNYHTVIPKAATRQFLLLYASEQSHG
jgi:hypothetical protein